MTHYGSSGFERTVVLPGLDCQDPHRCPAKSLPLLPQLPVGLPGSSVPSPSVLVYSAEFSERVAVEVGPWQPFLNTGSLPGFILPSATSALTAVSGPCTKTGPCTQHVRPEDVYNGMCFEVAESMCWEQFP